MLRRLRAYRGSGVAAAIAGGEKVCRLNRAVGAWKGRRMENGGIEETAALSWASAQQPARIIDHNSSQSYLDMNEKMSWRARAARIPVWRMLFVVTRLVLETRWPQTT